MQQVYFIYITFIYVCEYIYHLLLLAAIADNLLILLSGVNCFGQSSVEILLLLLLLMVGATAAASILVAITKCAIKLLIIICIKIVERVKFGNGAADVLQFGIECAANELHKLFMNLFNCLLPGTRRSFWPNKKVQSNISLSLSQ